MKQEDFKIYIEDFDTSTDGWVTDWKGFDKYLESQLKAKVKENKKLTNLSIELIDELIVWNKMLMSGEDFSLNPTGAHERVKLALEDYESLPGPAHPDQRKQFIIDAIMSNEPKTKEKQMTKDEFITKRTDIISEMLDNPDKNGIYPTTEAFEKLDTIFDTLETDKKELEDEYKWMFKKINVSPERGTYDMGMYSKVIKRLNELNEEQK